LSRPCDNGSVDGSEEAFFDADARLRLGNAVQAWIDARGTNKRQLSLNTKISRTTIDEIIKASRPAELETIARIAATLNVSLGALLDGKLPEDQPQVTKLPARGPDPLAVLAGRVDALEHQMVTALATAEAALELARRLPLQDEQPGTQ
jgi:transcriptional regulator with XRE-family HTH domain